LNYPQADHLACDEIVGLDDTELFELLEPL
jgi:hypothetical protein